MATLGTAALEEALTLYRDLSAERAAAIVSDELRRVGVRPHRRAGRPTRPLTGWAALTVSEQRVALLVSDGLTNRSTAAALCVSESTVSTPPAIRRSGQLS